MTQRIHKIIHGPGVDHFARVTSAETRQPLAPINAAIASANPKYTPYAPEAEICLDCHGLDGPTGQFEVPDWLCLRAQLSCSCCAPPCHHAEDHAPAPVARHLVAPANPGSRGSAADHAPGSDYCQGMRGLNELRPMLIAAQQRVAAGQAASLGAELAAEAAGFGLTGAEIEGVLGVAGVDAEGRLSTAGAAAAVLAGTATDATDYFWVLAFLSLWTALLQSAHSAITRAWPSRGKMSVSRLGPRQATSPGGSNVAN